MRKRKLKKSIKATLTGIFLIALGLAIGIGGVILASEQHQKLLENYEVMPY